jgi:NADH:ubiquinone oxidoreductase subunit 5 (subunit L)/multisubunit Na+/H+ antiporter MnhA subunit
MQWILLAAPALPVLAAIAIVLRGLDGPAAGATAFAGATTSLLLSIAVLVSVGVDGTIGVTAGAETFGLVADRAGAVLVVMVAAVTTVVLSFARRGLDGDANGPRFFALAAVLASSTMVVAVAGGAALLVAAWFVTGLTLAALVRHHAHWDIAVDASRRTRRAFLIGDAPLVAAVALCLVTVGDLTLPVSNAAASLDRSFDLGVGTVSLTTILALGLIIAGASRSALIPFHRWLPGTLAAPTPVSAMLHAGVVNGAGVLVVRFAPVVGSSTPAMSLAFVVGLSTAVWATAAMLVRSDVKGSLVYSTAGQMGFMTIQLAVGAFAAALFHIVGHAMYKAALFLGAGGSISAAADRRHLPAMNASVSPVLRRTLSAAIPAAAMALAFVLIDPHLTTAGAMLVAFFGWSSAAAALNGWLGAPPWAGPGSWAAGAVVSVIGVFGYVGGLAVFESFVADTVPFESSAAVGPLWLAGSLTAVALGAIALRHSSAPTVERLRQKIYVGLLGAGYVTIRPADSSTRPGEQRMRRPSTAKAPTFTSALRKGANS